MLCYQLSLIKNNLFLHSCFKILYELLYFNAELFVLRRYISSKYGHDNSAPFKKKCNKCFYRIKNGCQYKSIPNEAAVFPMMTATAVAIRKEVASWTRPETRAVVVYNTHQHIGSLWLMPCITTHRYIIHSSVEPSE